ncbi:MAG: hypothetical protein ABI396_11980 [Ktedonobacteraceae bacterium]
MNNSLRQFELQTWVAPLGVRFWDAVSGRAISDGLRVTAYPTGQVTPKIQAFTNHSGVYVWRNIPGLSDFEHGANAEQFLTHMPVPTRPFTVEVVDGLRRFQPFSFAVDVPCRGLFPWTCVEDASPPEPANTMVPLFSAPTRAVASGLAVIRALLWDVTVDLPAAWAVLEAWIADRRIARGFADGQGQVALIFPWPAPIDPVFDPSGRMQNSQQAPASPPLSAPTQENRALGEQVWSVKLQARYAPIHPAPSVPDLCATLQQAPAQLWSDAARASPLPEVLLKFGAELVVRSPAAIPRSVVLLSPTV